MHIRPGARYAAIEVAVDTPGQMAMYTKMLRPDVVVVTSIGSEHNRSFGTLEATRDEKATMVRCLAPTGLAVLNGDDPNVLWMRGQTKARVLTFGFDEANDVQGSDISMSDWPDGSRFTVHSHGRSQEMFIRLIGSPNINAALAAIAVALDEGYTLDDVQQRLGRLAPTPGRLQPVMLESGAVILRDDFKSPLETIHVALDVLSQIPARRRIVVLGRVTEPQGIQGDIYRDLGRRIAVVAERAVFVCDKRDSSCRAGAIQMGMSPKAITKTCNNLFKAAEAIKQEIGRGDVVLIKGSINQHLERITLALQGRKIQCRIKLCKVKDLACSDCPALEKG
jgi:UDP-N-acetylmuramoyl-tripeptide--D-alanyl-D-alanine ligase